MTTRRVRESMLAGVDYWIIGLLSYLHALAHFDAGGEGDSGGQRSMRW